MRILAGLRASAQRGLARLAVELDEQVLSVDVFKVFDFGGLERELSDDGDDEDERQLALVWPSE